MGGIFGIGGEERYVSAFDGMMHALETNQFGFFLSTAVYLFAIVLFALLGTVYPRKPVFVSGSLTQIL